MRFPLLSALTAALLLAGGAVPRLAAQVPTAAEIERLRNNPELVRERIRQSGLTPEQIRSRLAAAGYSPTLLDRYLEDATPLGAGAPSAQTFDALRMLGVSPEAQGLEALRVDTGFVRARVPAAPDDGLALFGLDVFRGPTTLFQPVLSGPVPSTYRLGPGDELVLVVTGDVELIHQLTVTREGFIVIPQVGQLFVNSVTMEQLNQLLRRRLGQSYSGIRTGTTRFDVTIARLRTNQVFVVGEVVQPGAYQLASVATVLNALYAAGGPTERANFRGVEVRRGDSTVAALDLYDYLLRADTRNDIVLEQGDIVFVPIRGPRVAVTGAVQRPAIYELRAGQTLADAVAMAGGFRASADLDRLTVHRILPPAERGPGPAPRAALDVPLELAAAHPQVVIPPFPLLDGDSVAVRFIPAPAGTHTVRIAGMVREPGEFPWREGMTLRDLVVLAAGPTVGADLREAEVARLPADRQAGQLADTLRVPLDSSYLIGRGPDGRYVGVPGPALPAPGTTPAFPLRPYDHVTIRPQAEFEFQRMVKVMGEVMHPGTYALRRKDERLSELVARAGGLTGTAYPEGGRLFRIDAGRVNAELDRALAEPGSADDIRLQPGDSLFVPEYIATVRVEGAVNSPASVLFQDGAGLGYYIENAGGYTRNADEGRVSVRYANGDTRVKSKFLFFSSSPTPGPGSTVSVPVKPEGAPFNVTQFVASVAQILASTVAIVVLATR